MIDAILGIIGKILYGMFSIFFDLIDLVQNIFRAFAGVGTIYYNDSGRMGSSGMTPVTSGNDSKDIFADDNGGIVYYLLRSDIVMNMVWSIATLALILLIVFTVIAFIKNIYAPKSKSWQELIGLSVKGLFNFIFIPAVCLIGIILGNILLNAIDGATSTGGATVMSRKLFLSAASDSNKVRSWSSITYKEADKVIDFYNNACGANHAKYNKEGDAADEVVADRDVEYFAVLIDEAYGSGNISIGKTRDVEGWYNMWGINYLVIAVGSIFMLYVLGSISFGMVKRMFTLIMLFIISPAACAMYPIDEGNMCKSITGDFKKNTISAYGAVAGMNIFFSIAPLVQNINLGSSTVLQSIVHLILLVCGLFMVKEFISKISGYIGAEDAYSSGASLMKQTKDKIGGTANKAIGTFARAAGARAAGGSFFGSLGRSAIRGTLGMTGIKTDQIKEDFKTGMVKDTDTDIAGRKLIANAVRGITNKHADRKEFNDRVKKRAEEKGIDVNDKEAMKTVRADLKTEDKTARKKEHEDYVKENGGFWKRMGKRALNAGKGIAANFTGKEFTEADQEKMNAKYRAEYENAKTDKEKEAVSRRWARDYNKAVRLSSNADKKFKTQDDFQNEVMAPTTVDKNDKNQAISVAISASETLKAKEARVESLKVQQTDINNALSSGMKKDGTALTAKERSDLEAEAAAIGENIKKALQEKQNAAADYQFDLKGLADQFKITEYSVKKFAEQMTKDGGKLFDKITKDLDVKSLDKEFQDLAKAIKKLKFDIKDKK